ncbi:MAG: hypothetical protein PHZ26_01210 [Candidatus Gracilibacteria bacterium]|nr:hypothetical protein [Candidatus Gracilibacteria bacterium]MDD2908353.1 hypothetical protein [Candidatus Gracilibacteria bacterium]
MKQHIRNNSFRQGLDSSSIRHSVDLGCSIQQKVVKIIEEDLSFRFVIVDKKANN